MSYYFSINLFKSYSLVNVEYYVAVLCTLKIVLNIIILIG
jgi:hypothetical protein